MEKDKLIKVLEDIRATQCAYINSENFCDCKFGYNVAVGKHGEYTGCPEMREAIRIIQGTQDPEEVTTTEEPRISQLTNIVLCIKWWLNEGFKSKVVPLDIGLIMQRYATDYLKRTGFVPPGDMPDLVDLLQITHQALESIKDKPKDWLLG